VFLRLLRSILTEIIARSYAQRVSNDVEGVKRSSEIPMKLNLVVTSVSRFNNVHGPSILAIYHDLDGCNL